VPILPGSLPEEFSLVLTEWLCAEGPIAMLWTSNIASGVTGFRRACEGRSDVLVLVRSKEDNVFGRFAVPA
jgi:hypothetical protein